MNWTDKDTKNLIKALKDQKCLYDEYRNVIPRNNAYKKISFAMGENFNMQAIKEKLNDLADDLMTQKQSAVTTNESGADNTPKKGRKDKEIYKLMEFITDPSTSKRISINEVAPSTDVNTQDSGSSVVQNEANLSDVASGTQNIKDENGRPDLNVVTVKVENLVIEAGKKKIKGKKSIKKQ